MIEKCSSPIGDGNLFTVLRIFLWIIEKCSSPIGDGNGFHTAFALQVRLLLRNVAPR